MGEREIDLCVMPNEIWPADMRAFDKRKREDQGIALSMKIFRAAINSGAFDASQAIFAVYLSGLHHGVELVSRAALAQEQGK